MQVNLLGSLHFARALLPGMVERGWGRMVFVGSLAGRMGGLIASPHYVASKGGLLAVVKWLARKGAPHGVAVNGVAPASVRTPLMADRPVDLARIPAGRMAEPEEVAWPIAFLCSDAASYIGRQHHRRERRRVDGLTPPAREAKDAVVPDRGQPCPPLRPRPPRLRLAEAGAQDQPPLRPLRPRPLPGRGRDRQGRLRRGLGRSGAASGGSRLGPGAGRRGPEARRHGGARAAREGSGRRGRSREAEAVQDHLRDQAPDRDRDGPGLLPGAGLHRGSEAAAADTGSPSTSASSTGRWSSASSSPAAAPTCSSSSTISASPASGTA